MQPRKLEHAALFLTVFGALLIAPPLVEVFNVRARLFGIPLEVIYLFAVWLLLLLGAGWLARRLPRDGGEGS